jgi:hypothetical protein
MVPHIANRMLLVEENFNVLYVLWLDLFCHVDQTIDTIELDICYRAWEDDYGRW